jgi:hypothetical protein
MPKAYKGDKPPTGRPTTSGSPTKDKNWEESGGTKLGDVSTSGKTPASPQREGGVGDYADGSLRTGR